MTKKKSAKLSARIAELEQKLFECAAQLPHKHYYVSDALEKYVELEGSGVIVTFQQLGTELKIDPILIRNGLSRETVRALQKDIRASWEDSVVFEPKVIKDDETPVQQPK
jgi:hypothetical protein